MSNRLLSTQDLADRLGIPSHTLSQWRRQGKGPCFIHIGSMIRYPVYEVELFERQFKSRSDWVVGQLTPEPTKGNNKSISGRLRRSEFSEMRTEAIITVYLEHLFSPGKSTIPTGAMEDYVRLMTLKITSNNPVEGRIEIDKERVTPEVLFVDLVNTLEKMTTNINSVLNHARSKLHTLDPIALQQAVDQYADMATRKYVRKWAGKQ
ncbi:MAG: helix-turn-helix transcriptional regulator [Limnohabitans sp.]